MDADQQDVLLGLNGDEKKLDQLAGANVLVTLPRPKPILHSLDSQMLAALCRQNGAHELATRISQFATNSQGV